MTAGVRLLYNVFRWRTMKITKAILEEKGRLVSEDWYVGEDDTQWVDGVKKAVAIRNAKGRKISINFENKLAYDILGARIGDIKALRVHQLLEVFKDTLTENR